MVRCTRILLVTKAQDMMARSVNDRHVAIVQLRIKQRNHMRRLPVSRHHGDPWQA